MDRGHLEKARNDKGIVEGKADAYEDYRKLLDRKDIDVVTISTPDHWHTRIAIAALKAGKDVYCQKPLTLTIDEGKGLCRVVKETSRVLQIGRLRAARGDAASRDRRTYRQRSTRPISDGIKRLLSLEHAGGRQEALLKEIK